MAILTIESSKIDSCLPASSATALYSLFFAIIMIFAALTSALIVRKGSSTDWQSFPLPPLLYLSTLTLIASSFTLERARRRDTINISFYITSLLGLLFILGQFVTWAQLRKEKIYLATNPSASFFFLLTATHMLFVLAGLSALLYVAVKRNKSAIRPYQLIAAARYWHFVTILWIYVLLLFWIKL